MRSFVAALLVSLPATAVAQSTEDAERAQIELLRRQVANEVQLAAFNLVDEMVYGWKVSPIFQQPTDVVLAGVTVPVGLGTALQELLENHLTSVLIENPTTNLVLTHCPACTAVIVHSGPKGTIVSRGVDNPEAFERLRRDGSTKHALFVDVEAEGSWLVLRARLTKLDTGLSIVWARTISAAGSAPSLLRQPDDIKSVEDARQEFLDALHDRWPVTVPAKLAVRLYNQAGNNPVNPPPFIWLLTGVELSLGHARAWTASFLLGYGYVPSSFDGFTGEVRIHRLLSGSSRSFTRPDLYLMFGGAILGVRGPSALIFQRTQITTEDIIANIQGNPEPLRVVSALHAGLELRVGNRLGVSLYVETLPANLGSDNIGTYVGLFHSIGTEISVWF